MTSPRSPSFEELLRRLPEEKQYLLDRKVENDHRLAEIAGEVTGWRNVLPYLIENDTEKAEETIFENYPTIERRRLVTSTVLEPMNRFYFESDCGFMPKL